MSNRLNPTMVRLQISNLLLLHPELEDDEAFRHDAIIGETDAEEFVRALVRRLRTNANLQEGIKNDVAYSRARKQRLEMEESNIEKSLLDILDKANLKSLELPEMTIFSRKGTPKVIITDETLLPDELIRIKKEPNLAEIRKLLMNGSHLYGAELSNAEPTLGTRKT